VALLRLSIGENRQALTVLHDRLEEAEAGVRIERARMHEIGATIAGIASASHIVHHQTGLSPHRKVSLENMLESEVGRLERLMRDNEPAAPTTVAIDEVIEPLVVAHQARARHVRWEPSGAFALARPDDLAEVINILLENAAQHAPHDPVAIDVKDGRGRVQIVVSDSGPGIPAEMRPWLFEWGARGRSSRGKGIGLNIAQRLMVEQAGDLRVRDSLDRGASFVVELKEPEDLRTNDDGTGPEAERNESATHPS
jgi:signal transduction histidine kinase